MPRSRHLYGVIETERDLTPAELKQFYHRENLEQIKGEIRSVRTDIKKVDDRLIAVESKLGGIHNRIDAETFARKDLEVRVRKILPTLPRSA